MRFLLASVLLASLASPAVAQSSVTAGSSYVIAADHDGLAVTDYELRDNGSPVNRISAGNWANGVIAIPGWVATPGSHALTVAAINMSGEAVSLPLTLQVQAPPPPSCPDYVAPDGTPTPHAGGDVIEGWNNFNTGPSATLADKQHYTDRIVQLMQWGFIPRLVDVRLLPWNGGQYPQVYLRAGCHADPPLTKPGAELVIPTVATFTDATSGAWSLSGTSPMRTPFGSSTPVAVGGSVTQLLLKNRNVYGLGVDGNWYQFTGGGWSSLGPQRP